MQPPGRLRVMQAAMLAVFALLALQLARVQLIEGASYLANPDGHLVRTLPIEPPRGLIVDRDGVPLATNVPRSSVELIPGDLPEDDDDRRALLIAVERATGIAYAELDRAAASGLRSADPLAPVRVGPTLHAEHAIAMRAALAGTPGVRVHASAVRQYAGGELLPRVLGFVGPIPAEDVERYLARDYPLDASVGQSGVELTYEAELRGRPGRRLVIADPTGREVELLGELPAEPGADLVLSIDIRLQQAAVEALREGIRAGLPSKPSPDGKPRLEAGAVVVMDVRSGELLALASLPSYDASIFSGAPDAARLAGLLADPSRPMVDRAYMEVKAPGSIFKPISALAALQEGVATPQTLITSTGALVVQDQYDATRQYVFRDWAAHGTLDLYGGLARSSDVYFYYLAGGDGRGGFQGLGADRLAAYSRAAGLGKPTGADLPGEATGLVPTPAWKEATYGEPWVLGDTYTFGIGQGYLTVTPLQMAVAAAAIANGGELLAPRVLSGLRRDGAIERWPREVVGRLPVDAGHIAVVREAMRRTADAGGTALLGEPAGVTIGGKTGTAEFGPPYPNGSFDTHGWYMSFAPFDAPEIAVVVYLEHGVGSNHAAPVARAIYEAYFGLDDRAEATRR